MAALTPKSQLILDWIQAFWQNNKFFPTYRDIQKGCGYRSVSAVQHHVKKLKAAGLVESAPDKARTLRLVNPKGDGIPVEGTIAASGFVNFFSDEAEKVFIPVELCSSRSRDMGRFALRVKGDSMIGASILDGDLVIFDKPSNPNEVKDKTIVAARIDGDNHTTLKRWHREKDQVFLIPENPDYPVIQAEASQVLIEGVYAGLIRGLLPIA